MRRRAELPGASELFRTTTRGSEPPEPPAAPRSVDSAGQRTAEPAAEGVQGRSGSGRRKHDAKITVYVSDEELLALEQARLALRAEHGIAVDRGRVVREGVAMLLADLEARGADSVLVRELRRESGE
ncbi:hypothetical protein ABZ805_18530 [Saccharopolyspora sp. NPDC047091]|uniref:hypothetical protein n=1 Tax=Saccharopolyspora sp. NPDC047091 TaxID=3155924 RepID=UPI0033EB5DE9